LKIISQAKKEFPNSPFNANLTNLENQIKNPQLSIRYEEQTLANTPILISANYQNVKKFSISIYRLMGEEDFVSVLYNNRFEATKRTFVRKEEFAVHASEDYKLHKTSFEIQPLNPGIYIAQYFIENETENAKNQYFYFLVSENKVIYQERSDKGSIDDKLKLVNSNNGKVLKNEAVNVFEYSGNKLISKTALKTDENGVFSLPKTNDKEYYRAYILHQPKSNSYQRMQLYGYSSADRTRYDEEIAQIFLDRKIYRPGQTVYFKTILTGLNSETNQVKTLQNIPLNITLRDTNDDEVETLKLTTNEFGSANGSFVLPKGKLNGQFSIQVDNDDDTSDYSIDQSVNFAVEEYKRPKFELTFEPLKQEYKYGQTVEIKGKAMMFSGVALSNTKVSYEIRKQVIQMIIAARILFLEK